MEFEPNGTGDTPEPPPRSKFRDIAGLAQRIAEIDESVARLETQRSNLLVEREELDTKLRGLMPRCMAKANRGKLRDRVQEHLSKLPKAVNRVDTRQMALEIGANLGPLGSCMHAMPGWERVQRYIFERS